MALLHSPEEKELTEGDPVLRNHNNTLVQHCHTGSPEEKELTEGDPDSPESSS